MRASNLFLTILLLGATTTLVLGAPSDAIVAFNNEAQQAVRDYGIPSQIASRTYSLVHIAQYRAISGPDVTQHPAQAGEALARLLCSRTWV